jgi:plastocyanin
MATGRRWLTLGISVLMVLMAWPLAGPARADSKTVLLKGTKFEPKTVEIQVADTVVWKYESGERHSLNFEDGTDLTPGCGGLLGNCLDQPGETRSRTFSKTSTFAYYCRFHGAPGGQGMSGVVKVTSTATTVPLASTSTTQPATSTTTAKPTTTTTRRPLTTSSTVISTTTTVLPLPPTALTPNEPPPFDPGDIGSGGSTTDPSGTRAASAKEGSGDSSAVGLIVALLLGVAVAGGFLLWRLRPGRGAPPSS